MSPQAAAAFNKRLGHVHAKNEDDMMGASAGEEEIPILLGTLSPNHSLSSPFSCVCVVF
jgi:hypothetical protein